MTSEIADDKIHILLVEDNPADANFTRMVMKRDEIANHIRLHHVPSGEEALAFLKKEGSHAGAPTPHAILLDLHLPMMDGREVLAAIKAAPDLKPIPVVVMTSSEIHEDIVRSYALMADDYAQKPIGVEALTKIVTLVHEMKRSR